MNSSVFFFIAVSICSSKVAAQGADQPKQVDKASLPVPNEKQQLFYLQRDPNANTVVYTLNIKDNGQLDEEEPVAAYWILYEENGKRKDLSFIQRKLAYGIEYKKLNKGEYEIHLASYKKLPMRLAYCPQSKQYEAFASINHRQTIVEKIFVRIAGGSLFKPHIDYIELTGRDPQSGERVNHLLPL